VHGPQILDGVLIANEVVDDVSRSKRPDLIFKVDYEKTYDSVNWEFLLYVIDCMVSLLDGGDEFWSSYLRPVFQF
jgi:hypothetical protein